MHAQLTRLEIHLKTIFWKEGVGFHSVVTEVACLIFGFDWPRKRLTVFIKCHDCEFQNYNDFFFNTELTFRQSTFRHKRNVKERNEGPESVTGQNWLTQPQ